MAVVQISKIQHRRGLQQDLPQLSSAELGWSVDTQQLYIGNGTLEEGAPALGLTEILTEHSIVDITTQINNLNANVGVLAAQVPVTNTVTLAAASSGLLIGLYANAATVSYSLYQGANRRTGLLRVSHNSTSIAYDEEYTEPADTDITFTMDSNSSYANLNYSTTTSTTITYTVHTPT
jgi:hypothetical protein